MEQLAEEGRKVCKCSARPVERRSCTRTAVRGFADAVVFAGDMRQDRAGGCCAGTAVL